MKKCPFNNNDCTSECALFISPDDMSETMRNKLASIGIISRNEGFCSFKVSALSQSRVIFEQTSRLI